MTLYYDIIVAGNYSIDMIFSGMTEYPQIGKDILSTSFHVSPGEAFISVVCLHRLGLKVGWMADFGNDEYSQLALKHAREEGLDETLFVFHDRPFRRISVAASYSHDRGFLTYYDPEPKFPAAIQALSRAQAEYIFIPGLYTGPFLSAGLKMIRLMKTKIIMDGNSSEGDLLRNTSQSKSIRKALRGCDIFLPNSREAIRLTGERDLSHAAVRLAEYCPIIIIKDGANGCNACYENQNIQIPAIPVKPVDTTGAGDNFNAGFICAWKAGKPLEDCLKWGNIAGGLSTTLPGGTSVKITQEILRQSVQIYYPDQKA